jgi:uroporphyrinogen decarboxylase
METTLQNLILAPELIEAMTEHITDFYYGLSRRSFEAAPGKIDIFFIGDDYAGQEGLLLSLDHWRRFFKKALARMFALAKEYGTKVMFHSCGAIRDLLPDLIDIGLDIIMPLQLTAKGMEPEALKRDFGQHITFYGGIDEQRTLVHGTEEEVRREVRARIDVLGRGGGYILSSSHVLLPEMPLSNILAMYDEATHYVPIH